jgi:hypothetical protein
MSSDLLERMRDHAKTLRGTKITGPLLEEAIAEIERMEVNAKMLRRLAGENWIETKR